MYGQDGGINTEANDDPTCNSLEFVLPHADVSLPRENRIMYNYYNIDVLKMRSEVVYLTYPSEDIPTINSLFSKMQGIECSLKKDSLSDEKWINVSVKIPKMPLNIMSKLMCYLSKNNIRQWNFDLRYDEVGILYNNKKNLARFSPRLLDENEYQKYIQNVDFDKLSEVDFYPYSRFSFIDYTETRFRQSAEIVARYWIDNLNNLEVELHKFSAIVGDFSEKYQTKIDLNHSSCERKGILISFDPDVPFLKLLKIINLATKKNLVYDCFFNKNLLYIYTKCDIDELMSIPYIKD
jgi:hypothetical protein